MSTLRVSNIEAKADPSSPSVDEKLKVTNSNGDVLIHIDGKTAGITTVGINTTDSSFTVDAAQNVEFLGIVTATKFSLSGGGEITGGDGNFTGIVTSGSGNFTGGLSVGTAVTAATANFTSSLTAASANFTGNVSIAGTLTYEDVTNVDSIGIATARTGIDVTGGHIDLIDNSKIRVGTGDDLQIYHDGSNSYIDDAGTGDLYIRSNRVRIGKYTGEDAALFNADGSIELYYDNSKKLETTTTGAKVTGALEVTQEYPSIRPTLDLNFAATKTLDRRITFTRDSVGTYIGENGLVKYASNNVPRFDHDSITGESLGLLIEESRTNSLTYSQPTSAVSFASNGTFTYNSATAPNGETEAFRVARNGSNSSNSYWRATRGINFNADAMVLSVWAKGDGGNNYFVWSFQNLGGAIVRAGFKLEGDGETSIITNGNGGHTLQIEKYPDGWYRCIIIGNTDSSGSTTQFLYTASAYNESSSAVGGSTLLWGFQLEPGSFATSYIPTSGSTVTRAQDFATIKGTNFTDFYNQTEGSLYSDFSLTSLDAAYNSTTVMITNNTTTNYLAIFGHNPVIPYAITGGSQQFSASLGGSSTTGVNYKAAMAFKLNDFAASLNGGTVSTDNSATIPPVDRMLIGRRVTLNKMMNGHIRAIKYFNKRLPNAQLQGLTQQ